MNKIIEFKDFTFKYSSQKEPTLRDINLSINEGEKVLIIGPSGSGKSTLGQVINGIIPNIYDGEALGTVQINGRDCFNDSIYDKSLLVSTVLQDTDGQFIGLTVAEDLAFSLENDMVSKPDMIEKIREWGDKLDLMELLEHRPQDLSGGQKQRVSLAGVLIDESPILLFDEPLANLDPHSGQSTIDLIDRIHKDTGGTILIIEHRIEDVLYRHIDRIILINHNRVLFNGSPEEILKTHLLQENGIREPLYIPTFEALGVDRRDIDHIDDVEKIECTIKNLSTVEEGFAAVDPNKEVLLETKNLNFGYTEKLILKDVSFKIYKGEKLAIIGKNGAGKSTLAKALCNFVKPEGEIIYEGEDIRVDSVMERAERIGYVLQNPNHMISQVLIFDEVALGLRLRNYDEDEIRERVEKVLKVCGLYPFRNWPISALSYGQRKRVTIASILVLDPQIILLDEPTAGQDEKNYTDIMNFLDELNEQGKTIVMITHDMQLMLEYSDRAVVVLDGEVIRDTSPAEVLTDTDAIRKANLKETSLFVLANKMGLDPLNLTLFYMQLKRKKAANE